MTAEETDTAGPALPKVGPEEIDTTFDIPAVFVNRAVMQVGQIVRITFGEMSVHEGASETKFRVCVAMPHTTAIDMARLLTQLLQDIEKEIETAKAEGIPGIVVKTSNG